MSSRVPLAVASFGTFQSIASWKGLLVSFTILDHTYEEQLSDHSGAFRVDLSQDSPQLAPHL